MSMDPALAMPTDPSEFMVPVRPGDTIEDILDALRRQGMEDLGDFVDKSLTFIKKKENDAQGDDDSAWVREIFITSEFVYGSAHQE